MFVYALINYKSSKILFDVHKTGINNNHTNKIGINVQDTWKRPVCER